MRPFRALVLFFFIVTLLSPLTFAVQPDRIAGVIDSSQMVTLSRGVHPKAQLKYDQGLVEPSFRLNYVTLLTVPSASQKKALAKLVAEQQDPKSPNYHKWLTPEQYADRFGLSQGDVERIKTWLESQGLGITKVARARNWIVFNGTADQVQRAFQTQIHRYNVDGEMHFANATAPAIPAALSGIATGFRGLHDFRPKPMGIRSAGARPFYNSSAFGDLVAPGDVKTIYGIDALYTQGIDGTGQKIAVAGQTDIFLEDIADFRSGFGLSAINCTTNSSGVITACNTSNFQYVQATTSDPGVSPGDLSEADLDIEWSGAVARNAQIIYVNAAQSAGGAFDAYYDAIDNNRAPVISLSYGTCERFDSAEGFIDSDEAELAFGNSEGITIVNSSGDSGAAECDFNSKLAKNGLAVAYPASSPEVTGIGGTLLPYPSSYDGTHFGTINGPDGGTALGYISETVWNDDTEIANFCQLNPSSSFCTSRGIVDAHTAQTALGISSTGGGASNCFTTNVSGVCTGGFAQPSWQTVTVSGQAAVRFSPDVSLMASPNFPGFIFCTQLSELNQAGTGSGCAPGGVAGITSAVNNFTSIIGGTSASAPVFAGMVALLNQYLGNANGLGNANPMLYQLAATAGSAFHDITVGNNKVYCTPSTPAGQPTAVQCPAAGVFGYSASTGYDLVTGLGSVNLGNLAVAWANPPDFQFGSGALVTSVPAGQNAPITLTVTPVNGFSQTTTFGCSGLPTGASCSFNPPSVVPSGAPVTTTLTLKTSANMAPSGPTTVSITATTGVLSQLSRSVTDDLTVQATTESFTLTPGVATITLAPGASTGNTNGLTVDDGGTGFLVVSGGNTTTALPLTYTCAITPTAAEASCAVSPSPGSVINPTVSIRTTAPTGRLNSPFERGNRIFYAMLLPGLFGIVLAAGSRRRGMRMLGLIVVLGCSTMWMGACGGSGGGGGHKDPGTPAGNYTVTVNATTGGASPLTGSTSFALVVQ